MRQRTGRHSHRFRLLVALAGLTGAVPALAQSVDRDPAAIAYGGSSSAVSEPEASPAPAADDDTIAAALEFDPAKLPNLASKPLRLPSLSYPKDLDVSRSDRPDGSGTMAVKKSLPTEWDAKVGADVGFASASSDNRVIPSPADQTPGSGAAWASLGLADIATVDARLDPINDQGKVGTTFKHSIPVGGQVSVTLQNSYSLTETYGAPASSSTPRVWDTEKAAKLDILPTGTTLGAALTSSSVDSLTHNTLSAEQKVYGPLHVTTAVTDVGQTSVSKRVSAAFKLNW